MPIVMASDFGSAVFRSAGDAGAADRAAAASSSGSDSGGSQAPCVPLGIVEMAFAGARSGASSSPHPKQRIAVSLLLPQAMAARSVDAAAAACRDAVSSHGLVVLASPPAAMPFPPSAGEVDLALRGSPGPAAAAIASALGGAARLAAVEAVAEGAPATLPPVSLDAMPAELVGSIPHVVIGGTFDRLHAGHWKLVSAAAALAGERLTVGVTSDAMVAGKTGAELIAPQDERADAVRRAAERVAPGLDVRCPIINDPMGPSATDATMGAIVVSSETAAGADAINRARAEAGLGLLQPFVVRRLGASGLSSTELRRG